MFEDEKHIRPVTKNDMIEFFAKYVNPSSEHRAKIAVHLLAQGVSKSSTAVATPAETPVGEVEKMAENLGIVEGNGVPMQEITDVRAFKSGMMITAGPRPAKDITEFEELDSKL